MHNATISPSSALSPRPPNRLLRDLIFMILQIGLVAWPSLTIGRLPGEVATVWVGNGILVGWLLSRPTHAWLAYVVAGFATELAVRLLTADSTKFSFALAAINMLEILIVAGAVRRLVPDIENPKRWLGLGSIATSSTLVACAISGLLASIAVSTYTTAFLSNFLIWYSAHVVGMVVVATLTLVAHTKEVGLVDMPGKRLDFFASMLLVAGVGSVVFYQSTYPLLFLAYPPLLFGVFRHHFAGLVVGVSLLAVIGSVATALGYGPLALIHDSSTTEHVVLLQLFIGTACLTSFPVALTMADRATLTARVRESELRYRMLADYSHDVVVRMRPDGQRVYVSPSARDVLGWEPAELLLPAQGLVHPDDRAIQLQTIANVVASKKTVTAIYRFRHKQGHYVWMEAIARPIPNADGQTIDVIVSGRDITERVAIEQALQASRRELEIQARVDSLTSLANRRQFDERLVLALARSRRQGLAVALMYMDIDHFKRVNDSFGHAAGDQVLRTFGDRLSACVRAGDLVARLGGDEFVVLVEDLLSPEAAEVIARKLIAAMREGIAVEGAVVHVTTSIGIAFSSHLTTAKALISTADAALYTAKKAGRNTWHLGPVGMSAPIGQSPSIPHAPMSG